MYLNEKAFTLAEVLITLAIIGVVAAMAIPSVISNAQQQEFKTGLRKAVSVLNSAITMNIALDGETPYDNGDLFRYLQKHMSVMKSATQSPFAFHIVYDNSTSYGIIIASTNVSANNAVFYTTDGMRFEFFRQDGWNYPLQFGASLHEDSNIKTNMITTTENRERKLSCGSYGLNYNPNNTTSYPCAILVDVNGDRKPYPTNVNAINTNHNKLVIPSPNSKKVRDTFTIMITEDRAIPFGVLAQKAMYQAQK